MEEPQSESAVYGAIWGLRVGAGPLTDRKGAAHEGSATQCLPMLPMPHMQGIM